jgi:tRNA (guanine26-N2/guanine27-N2)-dimethyltransferase
MAADRDLGVAIVRALRAEGTPLGSGWEMTAATGVRGLRLIEEAGPFERFVLSESNPSAFAVLVANTRERPVARAIPSDSRSGIAGSAFDYVDLDPYGSPTPFLLTALSSVRDGGVLATSATDMMVLAGAQPAACLRRYGARPVKGRLGPEGGLRILLAHMARLARGLGRQVRPLVGYVRDHHVRAYVRVGRENEPSDPVATVEPERWAGPSLGDRGPYGPLWLGPLFDRSLVGRLAVPSGVESPRALATTLARFREESEVDVPFYYETNTLAHSLALTHPPSLARMLAGLGERGFRAARTHARPTGFRTDAPRSEVEELARALLPR